MTSFRIDVRRGMNVRPPACSGRHAPGRGDRTTLPSGDDRDAPCDSVQCRRDAAKAKGRLLRAPKSDVVLEVSGVTAAKPPGFIAAVFVGDERVGEVSL